jgi:DNA (cytosine-5)-methyltransferase 1
MTVTSQPKTCLDFFAGSGLVSLALADFFETVWANDICAKKAQVYIANHGKQQFVLGAIENVSGRTLPDTTLSWGSFPCQDLSLAGSMHGLKGSRSSLVWQWLRVMDELRVKPPIAVAENVVGLVSSAGGENYRKVHEALSKRNYHVGAVMLDAAHWVPQSRKRIFVIAVDKHLDITPFVSDGPLWCHPAPIRRVSSIVEQWVWWKLPLPQSKPPKLESIVEFDAPCDSGEKRDYLLSMIPEKHLEAVRLFAKKGRHVFPAYKRTRNRRQVLELRFDGLAGCLRTPEGGSSRQVLVIAEDGVLKTRLLTVRETARLMGAPEDYKLPGSYNDGYKAMGDAVAVPVARFLAENLLAPIAAQAGQRPTREKESPDVAGTTFFLRQNP